MRYEALRDLSDGAFRRLTGVKRQTFEAMATVLTEAKKKQKARGGKPNGLSMEDQLLMMLGYWREYRTYFHIGLEYGKSESQAYRIVRWCEDTLAASGAFRLPGRKALVSGERVPEVVLIDATETPIDRPQKNSDGIIRARRSGTP
jgi:hypothetical protein